MGSQSSGGTILPEQAGSSSKAASLEFELDWSENPNAYATLHALQPPELPDNLTAGQAAQLAEVIEYLHIKLRHLIATAQESPSKRADDAQITLDFRRWQELLDLQSRLAEYMKKISEPGRDA